MVNFADVVENKTLDGDKVKMTDVMGKPIIVIGWKITNSKYTHKGTQFCTRVQFYYEDDVERTHHVFFTGSDVIREQIEEMEAKLEEMNETEFRTTVIQVGNYNSLS